MGIITTVGAPLGMQLTGMVKRKFTNRTGGTLLKGRVAGLDTALSMTEVLNFIEGDTASAYSNVAAASSAVHLLVGDTPVVMALEDIPDNEDGEFLLVGRVPFMLPVTDSGADNNCLKGDKLLLTQATTTLDVNQGATPARIVGRAEVTATVDISSNSIAAYFDGVSWMGAT